MALHAELPIVESHFVHRFEYADETARLAASGFTAADVKLLALQLDDNSLWMLTSVAPAWIQVGTGSDVPVPVQDEGSEITPDPSAINFVGAGVIVTDVAGVATVTIAGLPAGSGDVVGPASATDNEVPRFDGTTGKLLQAGSSIFIADASRPRIVFDSIDALIARQAFNLVEIWQESDLPIVSGEIQPVAGTVYRLMAPITTSAQLNHPVSPGVFLPAIFESTARDLNSLTSTGSGGAFLNTQAGEGQLIFQSIRILNTGSRVFADVSGLTQITLWTQLRDTLVLDFDDGTVFENCVVEFTSNSTFSNSGTIKLIDVEATFDSANTINFPDSGLPSFEIMAKDDVTIAPTVCLFQNVRLSSQATESFFFIHNNLIAGSSVLIDDADHHIFSPHAGTFFDSPQVASITALADSVANPGTDTTCSAVGHTVRAGDTVVLSGFVTQTQYNATFVATTIVAGVSFDVVEVFVATDTGTVTNTSLDEKSPFVRRINSMGEIDSRSIGSCHVVNNATLTAIITQNVWTDFDLGTAIESSNISRWSLTNTTTGELTYNGIEPFEGTAFVHLSATGDGSSPEYRFRVVKNGSPTSDGIESVLEAPAAQISSVGLVTPIRVVNGDTVRVQVVNIDGVQAITISHLSVIIQ